MCTCWLFTDAWAVFIWPAISNGICPSHSEHTNLSKRSRAVATRFFRVKREERGQQRRRERWLRSHSSPSLAVSPFTPLTLIPLINPRFMVKRMGWLCCVSWALLQWTWKSSCSHWVSETFCGLESPESWTKLPLGSVSFGLPFGDLVNTKCLELSSTVAVLEET